VKCAFLADFSMLWPSGVITTEELCRAMILAARKGGPDRVLESADPVALGRRPASS
jgi:hypothetical protein